MALRYCFETPNVRATLASSKPHDLAVIDTEGCESAVRSDIPTKTSELTNDSDYINAADGEAVRSQIPTKVSELTNDKGFIESVIDE